MNIVQLLNERGYTLRTATNTVSNSDMVGFLLCASVEYARMTGRRWFLNNKEFAMVFNSFYKAPLFSAIKSLLLKHKFLAKQKISGHVCYTPCMVVPPITETTYLGLFSKLGVSTEYVPKRTIIVTKGIDVDLERVYLCKPLIASNSITEGDTLPATPVTAVSTPLSDPCIPPSTHMSMLGLILNVLNINLKGLQGATHIPYLHLSSYCVGEMLLDPEGDECDRLYRQIIVQDKHQLLPELARLATSGIPKAYSKVMTQEAEMKRFLCLQKIPVIFADFIYRKGATWINDMRKILTGAVTYNPFVITVPKATVTTTADIVPPVVIKPIVKEPVSPVREQAAAGPKEHSLELEDMMHEILNSNLSSATKVELLKKL